MSEIEGEVPVEAPADPAPDPGGLPGVSVTQGLPDVTMIVNEGSVVSPSGEDRSYEGGEEIVVSGPDAIALAAGGFATAVGPAVEAPSENGAAAEAPPVEAPPEEAPPA